MLFNSYQFGLFFVLVFALYWAMRSSIAKQNAVLLVASYFFYGWWDVRLLLLLVITTCLDYWCALVIGTGGISRAQRTRASLFAVVSAFVFTGLHWTSFSHLSDPTMRTLGGWRELLPSSLSDLRYTAMTAIVVIAANLVNPWLVSFDEQRRRRVFLSISVIGNLGILGFFKYFGFFTETLQAALDAMGVGVQLLRLEIILPVAVSFFTFQEISYTVDVYRGKIRPAESLASFATYLVFFPQLMAGPIERGEHMIPQFHSRRTLDGGRARAALWLFAWGLFKKIVIADNMAVLVNGVFSPFDQAGAAAQAPDDGLRLLFGVYAFALQIYADFSGYSDMAKGLAALLGFELMRNFDIPYIATSPSDFWRRWHISLSSWLRDYLYIPLGGSRKGTVRTYINLSLTMLLGGLWHGAAWTFVFWGAFHGAILVVFRLLTGDGEWKPRTPVGRVLAIIVMFHLTCVGWLLFRAANLETVRVFFVAWFTSPRGSPAAWGLLADILWYSWPLLVMQVFQARMKTPDPMARWHWFVRMNVWLFIVLAMLTQATSTTQEFIYFAF